MKDSAHGLNTELLKNASNVGIRDLTRFIDFSSKCTDFDMLSGF